MKRVSVVMAAAAAFTLIAGSASAASNLSLRGIGLKAGIVNPEDLDMTLGVGVVFDLGTLHPDWAFETYAGFWSQTDEDLGFEFGVKDFSFGAKTKYMFETSNATLQPFVSGGLGLHIVNAHVDAPPIFYNFSADDTELKVGLDLGGGLRIDRGGQFAFLGEGWFTLISDVNHFSLMAGAVYMFGR